PPAAPWEFSVSRTSTFWSSISRSTRSSARSELYESRSLLTMARSPVLDAIPLRRTTSDLRTLLGGSLAMLRSQVDAFDVGLQVRVDDNVPVRLSLDRNKIAWAITALVGNALRYVRHGSSTMPGGTIVVHATYDAVERQVAIAVQDDGPGIA